MDLGRLPLPMDLRAGANRFRHRRARTIELEVRLDLDALAHALSRDDLAICVLGTSPRTLSLVLRDPVRTVALDLLPAWEGRDLVVAVRNVRAALEGPRSAIADAIGALRGYGAEMDPELGVLRLEDPLTELLTEALVPHGWRVPELASVARSAPLIEGRHLVFRTGKSGAMADETRAAFEDARVLAPVSKALVSNEEDALRLAIALGAKMQRELAPLLAIIADIALTLGQPPSAIPNNVSFRLRAAIARGDLEAVAECARELGGAEPCDEIAIEGLRAASALLREPDPIVAADLSARALGRRPRDGALAMEWLERASSVPKPETFIHALRSLRKTFVGPMRGAVLRSAGGLLDRAGEKSEALSAWEEACQLAPNDAAACEGLARSLGASSRHDEALSAWDRAARLHSDPDRAARALIHAASHARRASHAMSAASRLEAAASRARSDELRVEAWAELARIHREMGANLAAIEAETALLELSSRVASDALRDALFEAARDAVKAGAELRARHALDALRRLAASEPEIRALERELDAKELAELERDAPEQSKTDPRERALAARAIAERLRASGRLGDAALALARAGAITEEAATLRAALELAEKAGAWREALLVIDRAIQIVGDGPARGALESRRAAIQTRAGHLTSSR